jgi:predicted ATPase
MESKIKRVWFTGAHGTGKTTQLEYFRNLHPEYTKVDMERRNLFEAGIIKVNKEASPWDEVVIAGNAMLAFLSTSAPFISDRSWVCKCAYSQALPYPEELLDAWHTVNTLSFPGFTEEDMFFYFPPMIPLENDGVRSTDPEYQKEIDFLIQFYLDYFQIPFHTVESYAIQDRHFEIERVVFGEV